MMTIKSLANFGWILVSFWSMASSAVVVDQPISVLSRMDRSKLVELAFEKGWMPAQCSKELDFYNLPISSVPSYLRQGIFVSNEWSFPCLSAITKNPTTQSPERNYLTLLFTKLACAAVPENSVYFPELLLCKDAQWPNGCLAQDNPGKCLEQFNLTLEKNVQWLRKYSPAVFATLTGRSTVVRLTPPSIGPQLPPRLIDPAYFEPTKPAFQRTNIEIQSFQQRLTLVEELIAAPRVSGSKAVPVVVDSEVKPEKVDLSREQLPQPAPKPPKVTVTIKGSAQKPIPVTKPLTAKEARFKKFLEPVPDWAKKVHASAIKALTAPGYITRPGFCSAWVREVFQAAFPKQAMPLDFYYFGPSAAGLSRRGVLRGSTLGLWMANGRVKPYSQVGRRGLRAGDVVFQSYGFDNAGHIGIVVVNSAFPVKNRKGVKISDDLVIAENTQRHCRLPALHVGCPSDNRGVVSIDKFGDITHVGRFNGWAK